MCLTAVFSLVRPDNAHAHDPGLSSLDLHITSSRIIATLSLAPMDVGAIEDRGETLRAFAVDVIEVRVDGIRLPGAVERHAVDADTGSRVVLVFDRAAGSRLSVGSGVPARLAFGHRQLLTIRGADDRVLAERMLDAREHGIDLDLELEEGEAIWTESSYKYTAEGLIARLSTSGFEPVAQWIDRDAAFALTLARAA